MPQEEYFSYPEPERVASRNQETSADDLSNVMPTGIANSVRLRLCRVFGNSDFFLFLQSQSARIDKVFFAEVRSFIFSRCLVSHQCGRLNTLHCSFQAVRGIHQKQNGINKVKGPTPAVDAGLSAEKHHGNRGKKEKLRRVFRHLDVHN